MNDSLTIFRYTQLIDSTTNISLDIIFRKIKNELNFNFFYTENSKNQCKKYFSFDSRI